MNKNQAPTKLSTTTITLAVIASFIVSIALYGGLMWLTGDYETQSTTTYTSEEPAAWELALMLGIMAFVLLSPVIAAIIVWLKIRKKN